MAAFTKREREILVFLLNGTAYKDISQRLFISVRTVKFHAVNIFDKLDLELYQGRAALISKLGHFELVARWIPNEVYKEFMSGDVDAYYPCISHHVLHSQ